MFDVTEETASLVLKKGATRFIRRVQQDAENIEYLSAQQKQA